MSIKSNVLAAVTAGLIVSGAALAASAEDELLAVDRAFNTMAQEEGVGKAFAHYMSHDVRLLSAGLQPVLGHEAMAAVVGAYPPNATLVWDPEEAVVSSSADMGFTWGHYVSEFTDAEGAVHTSHGKYLNVWQKQIDGSWKVSVDIGNSNPAPEE